MKLHTIYSRFFIFGYRTAKKQTHFLENEGYLSMPGIRLTLIREKKAGTSVTVKSTSFYSASHSPPPIRPMVEKNPFFEIPERKNGSHNLIEECA